MRHALTAFALIILMPAMCRAQNHFQLGVATGLSPYFVSGKYIAQDKPATGTNATVKLVANFKHWQVGAGVEIGSVKGMLHSPDVLQSGNTFYVAPVTGRKRIASPYIAPYILVNYKKNFTDKFYAYAGVLAGRITTNNDLVPTGTANGNLFGLNGGVVLKLNSILSIEASQGWRYMNVAVKSNITKLAYEKVNNAYSMHSFPLQVGVRIQFVN